MNPDVVHVVFVAVVVTIFEISSIEEEQIMHLNVVKNIS